MPAFTRTEANDVQYRKADGPEHHPSCAALAGPAHGTSRCVTGPSASLGGLAAVPPREAGAAPACGMSGLLLRRRTVWPIAPRHGLPSFGRKAILMVRATSYDHSARRADPSRLSDRAIASDVTGAVGPTTQRR